MEEKRKRELLANFAVVSRTNYIITKDKSYAPFLQGHDSILNFDILSSKLKQAKNESYFLTVCRSNPCNKLKHCRQQGDCELINPEEKKECQKISCPSDRLEYCGLGRCWPYFDYECPCNGSENNLTCTEDGYSCFNENGKQND